MGGRVCDGHGVVEGELVFGGIGHVLHGFDELALRRVERDHADLVFRRDEPVKPQRA
jgi:hypothetical protein